MLHANKFYRYCCYKYYGFQCMIQLYKREKKIEQRSHFAVIHSGFLCVKARKYILLILNRILG